MAMDRDECKGVFYAGKFHVIGGYDTEMQGQFSTSAEAFDVATWQWDHEVQNDFLETATCPNNCVDCGDGTLYMCRSNDVVAHKSSTWQAVAELPAEVRSNTTYMTAWQDKMFMIGSPRFGEAHKAYMLNLKDYMWEKIEMSEEYTGHVQSGCLFDI
ncbi:F-box/kelch-repeat protein [Camellia lanceoleosa]|uniref:F-box/kelch-repeat protein n=1 Tax=Camellia lanceoleosa TaxID=1840588 RepID=A0ACC0FD19_9ERIC|nr:F-box/kelch-repeat protein [Camellia lanceoleosa]